MQHLQRLTKLHTVSQESGTVLGDRDDDLLFLNVFNSASYS